eukprot:10578-Heterococcus_DN1.PRE.2
MAPARQTACSSVVPALVLLCCALQQAASFTPTHLAPGCSSRAHAWSVSLRTYQSLCNAKHRLRRPAEGRQWSTHALASSVRPARVESGDRDKAADSSDVTGSSSSSTSTSSSSSGSSSNTEEDKWMSIIKDFSRIEGGWQDVLVAVTEMRVAGVPISSHIYHAAMQTCCNQMTISCVVHATVRGTSTLDRKTPFQLLQRSRISRASGAAAAAVCC